MEVTRVKVRGRTVMLRIKILHQHEPKARVEQQTLEQRRERSKPPADAATPTIKCRVTAWSETRGFVARLAVRAAIARVDFLGRLLAVPACFFAVTLRLLARIAAGCRPIAMSRANGHTTAQLIHVSPFPPLGGAPCLHAVAGRVAEMREH